MNRRIHDHDESMNLSLSGEPAAAPTGEGGGAGLMEILNDRLSGRWPHAIALGTVLAVVFAAFGYRMTSVKWDATGFIQVSPKISPLVRDTHETGLLPLYTQYLQTEARWVTNPRILERSVHHHIELSHTPWTSAREALRAIESNLHVRPEQNTELISVAYRAETPALAQYVTNAVLRAYDEIRISVASDEHGQTLQMLRGERDRIGRQRTERIAQLQNLVHASGYPGEDFRELIVQKVRQIEATESEIRRLADWLEAKGTGAENQFAEGEIFEAKSGGDTFTIHERDLEAYDPELAQIGRQRQQARMHFAYVQANWLPGHPGYAPAENRLKMIERLYRERATLVAEEFIASGHMPMTNTAADGKLRLAQLRRQVEEDREMAAQLQMWQSRISEIRAEIEDIDRRRTEIADRIHALEVEADSIRAGRLRIAAYAEHPLRPSQDRRRPLAAIGAMGGFGMGIAAFFLLGTIDRRVFLARQVEANRAGHRLLGVLPALPQRAGDVEASSVAAHCVHQIRNHIETARVRSGPVALVASSPYQGDGKTSLVMALGASYATAGSRVLLVDCDLVGKNLTTHSMMSGQPGLREALRSGDARGYAIPLPMAPSSGAVSILPVGNDASFGPEMIRREDLAAIIAQLRGEYDVILIDTGPLFGSIESLPAAAAADGVILTMQRGRRFARLEECIEELRSVGANYLGLVLNHARISDCDRYVSKSRISAVITTTSGDGFGTNGSRKPKPGAPRASRNVLLRAMQVTSRMDT